MTVERDDFPLRIKRVIAERAAYVCSNPACRRLTISAHSDPTKSLSSGVAAHIRGASVGGPRYDPTQTAQDRADARNGIWLCHSCSDVVDKDEKKYTVDLLEEWRTAHELWVAREEMVAQLPEISIATIDGLSLPPSGGRMSGEHVALFREHRLSIRNRGRHRLEGVSARLQIPERAKVLNVQRPAGVNAEVRPERIEFVAHIVGNGFVDMPKVDDAPIDNFTLGVDQLLPGASIEITLWSVPNAPNGIGVLSAANLALNNSGESLHFYMAGSFLYERNESHLQRDFIVPFAFDAGTRKLTSSPCEEDPGIRNRWERRSSW